MKHRNSEKWLNKIQLIISFCFAFIGTLFENRRATNIMFAFFSQTLNLLTHFNHISSQSDVLLFRLMSMYHKRLHETINGYSSYEWHIVFLSIGSKSRKFNGRNLLLLSSVRSVSLQSYLLSRNGWFYGCAPFEQLKTQESNKQHSMASSTFYLTEYNKLLFLWMIKHYTKREKNCSILLRNACALYTECDLSVWREREQSWNR